MPNHGQTLRLEYNYITSGIYIGTNQCCKNHFDETLAAEGMTADISLEAGRLDAPFGVDYYVWIPVENHTAPKREQLEFGVAVLEKLVSMGKKVYVHCQNGHGRAPTLVAAYLIRQGKSPVEAEDFIRSKRPAIHLEESQQQALKEFSVGAGGRVFKIGSSGVV